MHNSSNGSEIDQPMQGLPALAAELADGPGGRRQRQWNQQQPCRDAGRDEAPPADVVDDGAPAEAGVEPDICCQMQAGIEKSVKPQHAAKADKPAQLGN